MGITFTLNGNFVFIRYPPEINYGERQEEQKFYGLKIQEK